MAKKIPDQLSLNFSNSGDIRALAQNPSELSKDSAANSSNIFRLEEAQKKRELLEESKYVRAILDLVRHYK